VPKRKKLVPKPPKFKVPKKVPKRVATIKSHPNNFSLREWKKIPIEFGINPKTAERRRYQQTLQHSQIQCLLPAA
jgi:hypothetical protein